MLDITLLKTYFASKMAILIMVKNVSIKFKIDVLKESNKYK